ncbi:lipopolysaccharide biosynthesis protein [Pseudomonas serbica]|jgi:O-antigen/teichoic acid export membrane protein
MAAKKSISALSSPLAASAAAIVGRFLLLGTGALTGILLPLTMKQESVGLFFLCQSIIAALATLGQLGLSITAPAIISRAMGDNDNSRIKQTLRRTLIIGCSAASLFALTFWVTLTLLENILDSELISALQKLAPLISISMILAASVTLLSEQHRVLGHFVQASFLVAGAGVASAATVIIAWQSKMPLSLDTLLLSGVLGVLCAALLGGYSLWRWYSSHDGGAKDSVGYWEILSQTIPNLTTTSVLFIVAQADLWIIASFGSTADVAIYGLASRLAALVLIPLAVINTVIAPSIGRLWVRRKKRYLQKVMGIGAGAATGMAIIGYLLFALLGQLLISIAWPDEYSEAYYIFLILGFSQVIQTYAGTAGMVLVMLQKQHIAMRISIASGVLMIAGGSVAFVYFGIIGLALVYSSGSIIQSVLMIQYVRRIFDLKTTASAKLIIKFSQSYFR